MSEADKIDQLIRRIESALKGANRTKQLDDVAKQLVERIKLRTRLGKGLEKSGQVGGSPKPLAPLSKNYVKQRKSAKLSGLTKPGKSNLTRTGALLDAITHEAREGEIRIFLEGDHYSGLSAERLAEILSEDDAKRAALKAAGKLPSKTKKQRQKKSKILRSLRKLSKLLRFKKTKPLSAPKEKTLNQLFREEIRKAEREEAKKTGRPARPFMGLTDPEIKFFARIYGEKLAEIIEKALRNFKP